MMTIANQARYQRHRQARATNPLTRAGLQELWPAMLLFGSVGAITWAIRGTDGWGGVDGTMVPGMTWGLLWYYVCCRKGIDARGIPLWLGLGISVGGELGYGQYVSWIQGKFNVGEDTLPIAPWIGYVWFVICGIGWGATGGVALGWALSGRASFRRWLGRILIPLGVGFFGWVLVQLCPGLFFPNYSLGIYAGEPDGPLARTIYTNTQNFTVLAWWVGALLVAAIQKDKVTLVIGTLTAGGFGCGFTLGAVWCLGFSYAPTAIDWWKVWELNAGFNLGLLYALALHWAIRQVDERHRSDAMPLVASEEPPSAPDRRRDLSLTVSVFLLLLITFSGASLTLGGMIGLYDVHAIDQYAWPAARIAVFAPAGVLIAGVTLCSLWRIAWPSPPALRHCGRTYLPERVADLITGLGVIGVVTIWPSKIAVLYTVFVFLAIFSLNRLNHRLDSIDSQQK
jgi:hypothetical protein